MKRFKKIFRSTGTLTQGTNKNTVVRLLYVNGVLFVMSVLSLIASILVRVNTNSVTQSPVPFTGYELSTPVTMGLATVEITKVEFSDGQPGFVAPEGKHFVIVDFVVKNNAEKPIDVLPSSDTYMKSEDGSVSYLTPYNLAKPFNAGSLLPGEKVSGQLSYVIAKDGTVKLYVNSIWSGGVVSFKVQ